MNCQNVRDLLLAYLDNEINPSERMLIQSHLAGCDSCQKELMTLSATCSRVSQFLAQRAAQAAPSPQALSHLQKKLTQRSSPWLSQGPKRSAPNANSLQPNQKGIFPREKQICFLCAGASADTGGGCGLCSPGARASGTTIRFRFPN